MQFIKRLITTAYKTDNSEILYMDKNQEMQ